MLCGLSIRDVVLIDHMDISFSRGLTVLTGETGAGKSILLDALGLALGGRVDTSMRRHGAPQASVTATFEIQNLESLITFFEKTGLNHEDFEDGLLYLRRTIRNDGRSRAFINDQPVSANILRELGDSLIEIQGQFDAQGLLNPKSHRHFLDLFANHPALQTEVAKAYFDLSDANSNLRKAKAQIDKSENQKLFLEVAVNELDELKTIDGEETQLLETRSELINAEKIINSLNNALQLVGGDNGAISLVASAQRILDAVSERIIRELDPLERAGAELAETETILARLASDIEMDSGRLEEVDDRLSHVRSTARKYNVTPDGLTALHLDLTNQLKVIKDGGSELGKMQRKCDEARTNFAKMASLLSISRREAGLRLNDAIISELKPLKMERSKFETTIETVDEANWGVDGWDKIAFQIATNPGTPLGPLEKIASGGELSRLLLALRVALSGVNTLPTLIFDEVDAGVGGAVAAAVGEHLNKLGHKIQVLVVTHSPQVAARGHCHWKVFKEENKGYQRTTTRELEKEKRIEEIARMLAGEIITKEARAASLKILEG
jgi:DNA repair protein RecN (Recombination protein N)